jgi:hypothetical protein
MPVVATNAAECMQSGIAEFSIQKYRHTMKAIIILFLNCGYWHDSC